MDPRSFLTVAWQKEAAAFKKNLAILRSGHDSDALHDLRVAVKKLRALIELYIQLTGEALWEDPLVETETMFKICGRLRDTEIAIGLLKNFKKETGHKYEAFFRHLHHMRGQTGVWSERELKRFRLKEIDRFSALLRSEEAALSAPGLEDKTLELVMTGIRESQALFRKPHRLRQHGKKLYYWLRALPQTLPDLEKKLHEALDGLGDWQDHETLHQYIRHFRKDVLPEPFPEQDELNELKTRIETDNKKRVQQALKLIRSLKKLHSSPGSPK